jgi:hypothetical protein
MSASLGSASTLSHDRIKNPPLHVLLKEEKTDGSYPFRRRCGSPLVGLSAGLGAQTTGIAACDDFLKKYEACVTSKVPAAQKATYQSQLEQMRKAWPDAAKNAGAKAGLERACRQMSDQMKTAMASFGCTF